jgi:hypothetical protein
MRNPTLSRVWLGKVRDSVAMRADRTVNADICEDEMEATIQRGDAHTVDLVC